jgi:hypothetical protein
MLRSLALTLCILSTYTACKRGGTGGLDDLSVAESSVDSTEVGLAEADLLASSLAGAPLGVAAATSEDIAVYIATHLRGQYTPPACVTTTTSGVMVTAVFTDCTGPFGLVHVDGELAIEVRPSSGGRITVVATAQDLAINSAVLDLDATAVYQSEGGITSVEVTTRTAGTGVLGNDVHHAGDYTVTWDATCAAIDGAWSTQAGDRARSTTASIERCRGACPTGAVTRETLDDRTITLTFDGTSRATWTSSAGRSGSVPLACGAP